MSLASALGDLRGPSDHWGKHAVDTPKHAQHSSGPDPGKQRRDGSVHRVCSAWGRSAVAMHGSEGAFQLPWLPWTISAVPTQRLPRRPGEQRETHIGRALGRVGPSMLLCSASEAICFFMGEPAAPPSHGSGRPGCRCPFPLLRDSSAPP